MLHSNDHELWRNGNFLKQGATTLIYKKFSQTKDFKFMAIFGLPYKWELIYLLSQGVVVILCSKRFNSEIK